LVGSLGCAPEAPASGDASPAAPALLAGRFVDDYATPHRIDDTLWVHGESTRYRIREWHPEAEYLLAVNDSSNRRDGGLWARIDWTRLVDSTGWSWGFCIAAWDAPSRTAAESARASDRATPRTGCNGYPFTRMRRVGALNDGSE
jgi:hypothetical protein